MKCPYCNEDLKEWDGRFYCANALCPAKQEDLPKFIWRDLINGKKAQDALNVAIDALSKIDTFDCHGKGAIEIMARMVSIANSALYEITSITKQEE